MKRTIERFQPIVGRDTKLGPNGHVVRRVPVLGHSFVEVLV